MRIYTQGPTPLLSFDTFTELENTGTTIESDFTPEHADLIQGQRKKQKRAERKTKRGVLMLGGWSLNALMIYLIYVTARTVTKIWDPYEVLGISRVRVPTWQASVIEWRFNSKNSQRTRRQLRGTTESCRSYSTLIKPARICQRTLRHNRLTTIG